MDGTATAPIKVQAFRSDTPERTGDDPMVVRWGFNGVIRDKYLEGNRAGFFGLPLGEFFPLARFSTPEEVHSTDETMERERLVTKTALSVERYLGETIGGRDAVGNEIDSIPNFGFVSGFYGELDVSKMKVMSVTLLPTLPQIRAISARLKMASPISAKCEGEDAMDAGKTRQNCPTCWFKWLQSPVCDAYVAEVSATGLEVEELDPSTGQSQNRLVAPTLEEFAEAKRLVLNSIGTGLAAQSVIWSEIETDIEDKAIRGITAYQHGIRKDLHRPKPQDKEMTRLREFANASQGGHAAPAADNSEILMMLAQSQAQTNALLAKLVEGGKTPALNIAQGSETPIVEQSNLAPAAQKMEAKKQEKK